MNFVLVKSPAERVTLPGEFMSASVSLRDINWDREIALIVDLGEQRTGGHGVAVTGIDLADNDQVNLTLRVTRPGPGQFVMQAITHPYAVCRLPRVGLRPGEVTVTARSESGTELARQVVQF